MVQHTPWVVDGGPVRPTPPVRGRCPEGAEGVGITGLYEKKNGRAGSIRAGGHTGPPLRKGREPYPLTHTVRPYIIYNRMQLLLHGGVQQSPSLTAAPPRRIIKIEGTPLANSGLSSVMLRSNRQVGELGGYFFFVI